MQRDSRRLSLAPAGGRLAGLLAALALLTWAAVYRPSPDSTTLASPGPASQVTRLSSPRVLSTSVDAVQQIAFSRDGAVLAAAGAGSVQLWDSATGRSMGTLPARAHPSGRDLAVRRVALSRNGTRLAAATDGGTVVWDVGSGHEPLVLPDRGSTSDSVALSPDGATVASGDLAGQITLWNAATGREIRSFRGHDFFVHDLAFSPDGALLAAPGYGGWGATLWELATGREVATVAATARALHLAFSPDGTALVVAGDRTARLVEVANDRQVGSLDHGSAIGQVDFAADGSALATVGVDGSVAIWNVTTAAVVHQFRPADSTAGLAAYTSRRRLLATSDGSGPILLWRQAPFRTGK